MAGLARQLMPGKERTASYAEWLAHRATELAPGHAVTWWTYANWLLATNRCAEALKAMAQAEPLVPNSPKFYNEQGAMMVRCGQ
jgi:cytochrome c-type biogenesis protein CcmH/NrfG